MSTICRKYCIVDIHPLTGVFRSVVAVCDSLEEAQSWLTQKSYIIWPVLSV